MKNEMATIIISIFTIASALVSMYVIPYIKTKMSAEQIEQLTYYIQLAVRCAEQIYTAEQWKTKKIYVFNHIRKLASEKLGIDITDEELDILIEGIVNEVKHGGQA